MRRATLLAAGLSVLAAPPALAAGHWTYSNSPDGPFMTVGEADGESPVTNLHCKPHAGRIEATLFVFRNPGFHQKKGAEDWLDKAGKPPPWATTVHVASGAVTLEVPAKTDPDEMNGDWELELALPTASPLVQAFAKTGALRFTAYGESPKDPPIAPAMAAKLVKACGK
jgi:hypothetical protein